MKKKLKIVISGIGNRALPKDPHTANWLGWVKLIKRSVNFQLVAAHDVSTDSLNRIIERGYLRPSQTYQQLDNMLKDVTCDAILISNPAKYHSITMRKALDRGLHMLIEKPFVSDIGEGKKIVDIIENKAVVAAVVQNWRCKDVGRRLHDAVQSGMIGRVGHIFFRYIRNRENPRLPAYIFDEEYPLLYAMGIHHLDLCRFILQDEFELVRGSSFKPPWSLYQSDTGLNLFLKTKSGVAVTYSGTISSTNKVIPQESLIVEGEKGTLFCESQWLEPPLWFYPAGKKERIDLTQDLNETSIVEQYNKSDDFILNNFYKAIMGDEKPICTASDGLQSVAVLEGSRTACETGKSIIMDRNMAL